MNFKQKVGIHAATYVQEGMRVGLGTGSTTDYFIQELARRVKEEGLKVTTVSSSHASHLLALELGLPLIGMDQVDRVDLYVDGADEVTPEKNLLKGRGAAMLREKILAFAAQRFLVIVETGKLVEKIGSRFPIPVEVMPLAYPLALRLIGELGGEIELRMAVRKDGPVITDMGNFVLDVRFPKSDDVALLDAPLNAIPGVAGHGLFCGLGDRITVITGDAQGVREWTP